MDSFENIVAMLLRRHGYWTTACVKVHLTQEDKHRIGLPSCPRWEIDIVAYKPRTNELLAVECKSFLDSPGVKFRNGHFERATTYKLFENATLRETVLNALARQLLRIGACRKNPNVKLGLAIGKLAGITELPSLQAHFEKQGWELYLPEWIAEQLTAVAKDGYENDVACVTSKLLLRKST